MSKSAVGLYIIAVLALALGGVAVGYLKASGDKFNARMNWNEDEFVYGFGPAR